MPWLFERVNAGAKTVRLIGEKEKKLYIDPEECIDCGACEPVCPVEAIFEEAATPDKWKHFIQIDADWFKARKGS
jgi:NAD-dependent dihydropyrimidine dehydrogenase PreA subunit